MGHVVTEAELPWQGTRYLASGNERQQAAYGVLRSLRIFEQLRPYGPVLVGTIPIGVDVPESDLDIVCEAYDLVAFQEHLEGAFGRLNRFQVKAKPVKGVASVIARFGHAGFTFEVFGQPRPVVEQHAYRHLLVEARLLKLGGEPARRAIRRLKRLGLKTEPAFAYYFKLEGDPFDVLLELSQLSDEALRDRLNQYEE
jgi:hypothetical protein